MIHDLLSMFAALVIGLAFAISVVDWALHMGPKFREEREWL